MNKITLLLIVFLASIKILSAQNFEGVIEMHQVTTNGLEYDLKWYIKGDKIAYELSTKSSENAVQMRFVPQKSSNSMLMISGNTKTEIPSEQITAPVGFSMKGAKFVEKGTSSNSDFKSVKQWEITTDKMIANVEVTTDIGINFAEHKQFFKSDYGLCALAESGKAGFPLNITIQDKAGNVLTKTTLKKVTRMPVADSFFQ
ncbi:MAG: DUF4412 domain-containing protein [Aureispira sp.]|nr:DUF4412 domain-containing protein [Aureispira sp.]